MASLRLARVLNNKGQVPKPGSSWAGPEWAVLYTYMSIYGIICVYIYIYIYTCIYTERERET